MNERDMVHNYGPSGYVSPRSVEEKMRQMADANDGKVALANRVHELEAEVSRLTAELAARTEDVATLKSTLLSDEEQMRTLQKRIDSQRDLTIAAGLDAGKYLVRAETVEAELAAAKAERDGLAKDERYFDIRGQLIWGCPVNVQHLILQLQTLNPEMKVSSVTFVNMKEERKARAFGLSLSRERWDEHGWLNFRLPGPECLALWASQYEAVEGVNGPENPAAILARVKAEGRKSLAEDFRAANPNELFFNLELARLAAQPEGSESK